MAKEREIAEKFWKALRSDRMLDAWSGGRAGGPQPANDRSARQ